MAIKMYNNQVCHNPQHMAKNRFFFLFENPTLKVALTLIWIWKF